MDSEIAFRNVSKIFLLRRNRIDSLKSHFIGRFNMRYRERIEPFTALDQVSFEIRREEWVGVIGRNGAGKSTLLRLAAGILKPTSGRIDIHPQARILSLIDLTAGFHMDLPAIDNVFFSCSLYGLSRSESRALLPEIVEFSELREFMDVPIKFLSNGMQLRLGFAIVMALDPEIFLCDDIMAVGDLNFHRKCLDRMKQFRRGGRTLLLVTHNLEDLPKMCPKTLILERGRLVFEGTSSEAISLYKELMRESSHRTARAEPRLPAPAR